MPSARSDAESPAAEAATAPTAAVAAVPSAPFSRDTLYSLLVAELAGQRDRFDIALANYVEQAHATAHAVRGAIEAEIPQSEVLIHNEPEKSYRPPEEEARGPYRAG